MLDEQSTFEDFMEMLPAEFQESGGYISAMRAMGNEFDRIQAAYIEAYEQSFVPIATWGLALHEAEVGLPISPPGVSYEDRRLLIMAKKQARTSDPGRSFVDAVKAIHPVARVAFDRDTHAVRITLPLGTEQYVQNQIDLLVQEIIPAHLDYAIQYSSFVAGVSKAGDSL